MKRKIRGFTLVEMVITVTLIIILMSISVPIYRANTKDTKIAEAYALLAAIRSAQEKYYVEHGVFAYDGSNNGSTTVWTTNNELLDINARTNKYYTWFSINCTGIDSNNGISAYAYQRKTYGFLAAVKVEKNEQLQMSYNLTAGVIIDDGKAKATNVPQD